MMMTRATRITGRKVAHCATRTCPTPARLADLVGQHRVMSSLQLAVDAARIGEPMGHTLLSGQPGRVGLIAIVPGGRVAA